MTHGEVMYNNYIELYDGAITVCVRIVFLTYLQAAIQYFKTYNI